MKQDCDEVIRIINYYIEVGANASPADEKPINNALKPKQEQRIKVNDKTATGGWF